MREEEARREAYSLKQRIAETEASREALVKENSSLARKQAELEDTLKATEREFSNALSDNRDVQSKLKDDVRHLSQQYAAKDQEATDLKIRLSDLEGRSAGLECELAKTDQENGCKYAFYLELPFYISMKNFIGKISFE